MKVPIVIFTSQIPMIRSPTGQTNGNGYRNAHDRSDGHCAPFGQGMHWSVLGFTMYSEEPHGLHCWASCENCPFDDPSVELISMCCEGQLYKMYIPRETLQLPIPNIISLPPVRQVAPAGQLRQDGLSYPPRGSILYVPGGQYLQEANEDPLNPTEVSKLRT